MEGAKPIGLTRLAGSSKAYFLSHWREKVRGPLLVVVPHLRDAEILLEDLRFFLKEKHHLLCLFPEWETLPYDEIPPHPEIVRERVRCLFSLLRGEEAVVISSIKALMQKVLSPSDLRKSLFSLFVGCEVNREQLIHFLKEF
jgi:transcription-repair coupling factor (superfamily II helicase)